MKQIPNSTLLVPKAASGREGFGICFKPLRSASFTAYLPRLPHSSKQRSDAGLKVYPDFQFDTIRINARTSPQ